MELQAVGDAEWADCQAVMPCKRDWVDKRDEGIPRSVVIFSGNL